MSPLPCSGSSPPSSLSASSRTPSTMASQSNSVTASWRRSCRTCASRTCTCWRHMVSSSWRMDLMSNQQVSGTTSPSWTTSVGSNMLELTYVHAYVVQHVFTFLLPSPSTHFSLISPPLPSPDLPSRPLPSPPLPFLTSPLPLSRHTCAEKGRLMAQYCVAFESAKKFLRIKGTESVGELVCVHTHAHT